ncbi:MAG: flavodoxin family protein [Candidatus Thorarchaeota archaeon SMTZ1-45]|nr:MAG: iron-sulfur protein [Candidatus Thorarchaeota archaeon SMTZ1-45]
MKVLVINGSPRKNRGSTGGILSHFVEGMKEAHAEIDVIFSEGLDLGDCRGCFNCWTSTPGKCIQDDEMVPVLEKIDNADIVVIATPVYVDGMTGSLKTLLDWTIPLLHGAFELRDDHCRHALREHVKPGKFALVSVCGFTEMDNFDPLITHVKAISKNMNREFLGSVLRPYAWIFDPAQKQGADIGDILDAVKEAGRQLVSNGKMDQATLATIAREIIPRDQVIQLMQQSFGEK